MKRKEKRKRLCIIYATDNTIDRHQLDSVGRALTDQLNDNEINMVVLAAYPDIIIQIVNLDIPVAGEYECITITKDGIKPQRIPMEIVEREN
jgi:hypothetical protein